MVTNKKVQIIATLAWLCCAFSTFIIPAQAQTGAAKGLTVTPFLIELQMAKGQTISREIELININPFPIVIQPQNYDFLPYGDLGQQTFFEPGTGDPSFSLASWISAPNTTIQLEPGGRATYKFSITPPQNADNGGHYGAVLFNFEQVGGSGSAVQITQKIGTLILVKLGKAQEDGNVNGFQTTKAIFEFPPIKFVTRFKNTGNVHLKPRGGITIYNSWGKKVGLVKVNENAFNVLPNSERQFEATWDAKRAFGRYSAEIQLSFGESGALVTATTHFWVIPWRLGLEIILGLFIGIIVLIQLLRAYNRWVLRQVRQTQAPKPRQNQSRNKKTS